MKRLMLALLAGALTMPAITAEAAKRPHVVIAKPLPAPRPPLTPVNGAVMAVIPLALAYDMQRRWTCTPPPPGDPLGLGGPGFDKPVTPADGNVMIPACQRLYYQPKSR